MLSSAALFSVTLNCSNYMAIGEGQIEFEGIASLLGTADYLAIYTSHQGKASR